MVPKKTMDKILKKFEQEKVQYLVSQAEIAIRIAKNEVRVAGGNEVDVADFQLKAREILERYFTKYREKNESLNEISDTSLREYPGERAREQDNK